MQRLTLSSNKMENDKRFKGLTDQVDIYLNMKDVRGSLSEEQKNHLRELRDTLFREYGAAALEWINDINEAL